MDRQHWTGQQAARPTEPTAEPPLAGQHNLNQRIQHLQRVKEENAGLRAELAQARDEHARVTARWAVLGLGWVFLGPGASRQGA